MRVLLTPQKKGKKKINLELSIKPYPHPPHRDEKEGWTFVLLDASVFCEYLVKVLKAFIC